MVRGLEFQFRKKRGCTIYVAIKIKDVVTRQLICAFVFAYAEIRFSHDGAHMSLVVRKPVFGVSHRVLHKPGCEATEDG